MAICRMASLAYAIIPHPTCRSRCCSVVVRSCFHSVVHWPRVIRSTSAAWWGSSHQPFLSTSRMLSAPATSRTLSPLGTSSILSITYGRWYETASPRSGFGWYQMRSVPRGTCRNRLGCELSLANFTGFIAFLSFAII